MKFSRSLISTAIYFIVISAIVYSFKKPKIKAIAEQQPEHAWLNPELAEEERIELLLGAITLDEKMGQLLFDAPGIPRLGILPYNWWNECLHGLARNGRATVFPQAIALGASFDTDLAFRVADAISSEARAKFELSQKAENYSQYAGLTFWTPNINIFRDPRWGRGQETYGEDPFLTSRIGVSFVKGLQGDNPRYLKAAACAKHYAVHSGPEALRHEFNAEVSLQDLRETYLPAFEALVKEAKVEAVMGAYNRTNGEACCASELLLKNILLNEWNFQGHIVSDCGAIRDIYEGHKLVSTPEEAAALAVKSGLNLNCGSVFKNLPKAVEQGLLTEEDINNALRPLLRTKLRLGFFDAPELNPYTKLDEEEIGSQKNRNIAYEAALKSIVMVKNNNVLPLKKEIRTLYVTGPQAANEEVLLGNYYGVTDNTVNILDGIVGKVSASTTINYKYGQLAYQDNVNPIDWTTGEASWADACIAVMGINGLYEGEEGEAIESANKGDKTDIKLPENQIKFLKKIRRKGKNPLIVVITGGSPIAIPEVYDLADAVLYVWYPGQEGGRAIGDILFGDASPSGRLPFTVPYSVNDLPPYENYSMKGRTYKYMETEPQFPIEFGLSYTRCSYSDLKVEKVGENILAKVNLKNIGGTTSEEVAQLYVSTPEAGKSAPISKLIAFKRVKINPGESKSISFEVNEEMLKSVNSKGEKYLENGNFVFWLGGCSPGSRSETLMGEKIVNCTIQID